MAGVPGDKPGIPVVSPYLLDSCDACFGSLPTEARDLEAVGIGAAVREDVGHGVDGRRVGRVVHRVIDRVRRMPAMPHIG
jgi:hypothetical protein